MISDVRAALRWCLSRGQALELLAERHVLARLRGTLKPQPRLGGQAAIGATLFARFEAELSILHPDRLSTAFCSLLRDPRVLVPIRWRGRPELVPSPRALRRGPCEHHLIIELPAGVRVGAKTRSARATRLILAPHDPVVFDDAFEELLPAVRERLDLAIFAGFNHFGADWKGRFDRASRQLQILRRGASRPLLHLECTAMTEPLKWRALASRIIPFVDSIGLNEQELSSFTAALQRRSGIAPEMRGEALIDALCRLLKLGPNRVHLHTHGAAYLAADGRGESQLRAVRFGAILGCCGAAFGRIPRLSDLRRPWAALGLQSVPTWQVRQWGKTEEGPSVFRLETPLVPRPKATVGLGDLISLGAVAAEARSRRAL